MPRPRDKTPRSCPLCGRSDAPAPTSCKLCHGTGVVSLETWAQWALRPPASATSTTIDIRKIAAERLVEVQNIKTSKARDLVLHGEGLLAVIDSWLQVPADGPERGELYQQINAWLSETSDEIRRHRSVTKGRLP